MAKPELLSKITVTLSVFALFTQFSRSQLILRGFSDDSQPCESTCAATYTDKVPDLTACKKGCRLMTIIDFMEEQATLDELRTECQKACLDAYGGPDNSSACAFGCQGQLPAIDSRRKQIISLYDEEAPVLHPFSPVHVYVERMMDCMMDHLRHEMTMAMTLLSMSGQHGQILVIQARPPDDSAPEYKTSNYVETNLVFVDSGATPDIKGSQMVAASPEADLMEMDKRHRDSDWLGCLAAKIGLSKMSFLFLFLIFCIGILWLCISSVTTSVKQSDIPSQKLSIYGDSEFLLPIDEKIHFSYVKPQEPSAIAPALPVKITIQEI